MALCILWIYWYLSCSFTKKGNKNFTCKLDKAVQKSFRNSRKPKFFNALTFITKILLSDAIIYTNVWVSFNVKKNLNLLLQPLENQCQIRIQYHFYLHPRLFSNILNPPLNLLCLKLFVKANSRLFVEGFHLLSNLWTR